MVLHINQATDLIFKEHIKDLYLHCLNLTSFCIRVCLINRKSSFKIALSYRHIYYLFFMVADSWQLLPFLMLLNDIYEASRLMCGLISSLNPKSLI